MNCLVLCDFCNWLQGLDVEQDRLDLISNVVRRTLNIECSVLMGANVAPEVSIECFCEATIGTLAAALSYPNYLLLYPIVTTTSATVSYTNSSADFCANTYCSKSEFDFMQRSDLMPSVEESQIKFIQ